jgi:hypothetical protein
VRIASFDYLRQEEAVSLLHVTRSTTLENQMARAVSRATEEVATAQEIQATVRASVQLARNQRHEWRKVRAERRRGSRPDGPILGYWRGYRYELLVRRRQWEGARWWLVFRSRDFELTRAKPGDTEEAVRAEAETFLKFLEP